MHKAYSIWVEPFISFRISAGVQIQFLNYGCIFLQLQQKLSIASNSFLAAVSVCSVRRVSCSLTGLTEKALLLVLRNHIWSILTVNQPKTSLLVWQDYMLAVAAATADAAASVLCYIKIVHVEDIHHTKQVVTWLLSTNEWMKKRMNYTFDPNWMLPRRVRRATFDSKSCVGHPTKIGKSIKSSYLNNIEHWEI